MNVPSMALRLALATLAFVTTSLFTIEPVSAAELRGVQSGTVTLSAGSSSVIDVLSPAVTTSSAFLVFGVQTTDSEPSQGAISGELTNATTVTFRRDTGVGAPAATIHWYVAEFTGGVTVQRGSVGITGLTSNVSLSPSVDPTKSFPLINQDSFGSLYGSDDFVRARITGGGSTLELAQNQGTPASNSTYWQVVEYADCTVQTGDVSFGASDASVTDVLSPSVDLAKSWLICDYKTSEGASTDIGQKLVSSEITSTSQVRFSRDNTGEVIDLTWFLVEFTDSTTVQHGLEPFSSLSTVESVTLSSVDLARSIATAGGYGRSGRSNYSADDTPGTGWYTLDITSPTNLEITRGLTGSVSSDVGWYVVEFGPPALEITKRAFLLDGTPIVSNSTVPRGTNVHWMVYVNNRGVARSDISLQDVLDPAFSYVTGTLKYDNSVASCAADTCTALEEAAIYTAVNAGAVGSDAVDGDVVSFAGTTVNIGDETVGNARLDIAADRVFAVLFQARVE